MSEPEIGCAVKHADGYGNATPCPDSHGPEAEDSSANEGHAEPPTEDELSSALPVQPDRRQLAYDAVYEYIRALGAYLPPDPAHRNAVIWRAVHAALDATPLGRCISSHCVEGAHILPVEETPWPSSRSSR
jgi:hypothetical protein